MNSLRSFGEATVAWDLKFWTRTELLERLPVVLRNLQVHLGSSDVTCHTFPGGTVAFAVSDQGWEQIRRDVWEGLPAWKKFFREHMTLTTIGAFALLLWAAAQIGG